MSEEAISEIIKGLNIDINMSIRWGQPANRKSFSDECGIILTRDEASLILDFIKNYHVEGKL